MTTRNILIALAALPLLAACASTGTAPVRPAQSPPRTVAPAKLTPPKPRVQVAPGLEGVIGVGREDLIRQFGPPRLDVWEGDARKLQFTGKPCVLDVYLYPPGPGAEPEATYVDARRASDGQDVDRASCIAALRRK